MSQRRLSPGQISLALGQFGGMFAQTPQQFAQAEAAQGMAQGVLAEEYRKQIEEAQKRRQKRGLLRSVGAIAGQFLGGDVGRVVGAGAGDAAGGGSFGEGVKQELPGVVMGMASSSIGKRLEDRGGRITEEAYAAGNPDSRAGRMLMSAGSRLQSDDLRAPMAAIAGQMRGDEALSFPTAPAGLPASAAAALRGEVVDQRRHAADMQMRERQMALTEQTAAQRTEAHEADMARRVDEPTTRELTDQSMEMEEARLAIDRDMAELSHADQEFRHGPAHALNVFDLFSRVNHLDRQASQMDRRIDLDAERLNLEQQRLTLQKRVANQGSTVLRDPRQAVSDVMGHVETIRSRHTQDGILDVDAFNNEIIPLSHAISEIDPMLGAGLFNMGQAVVQGADTTAVMSDPQVMNDPLLLFRQGMPWQAAQQAALQGAAAQSGQPIEQPGADGTFGGQLQLPQFPSGRRNMYDPNALGLGW